MCFVFYCTKTGFQAIYLLQMSLKCLWNGWYHSTVDYYLHLHFLFIFLLSIPSTIYPVHLYAQFYICPISFPFISNLNSEFQATHQLWFHIFPSLMILHVFVILLQKNIRGVEECVQLPYLIIYLLREWIKCLPYCRNRDEQDSEDLAKNTCSVSVCVCISNYFIDFYFSSFLFMIRRFLTKLCI